MLVEILLAMISSGTALLTIVISKRVRSIDSQVNNRGAGKPKLQDQIDDIATATSGLKSALVLHDSRVSEIGERLSRIETLLMNRSVER